LIGQKGGEWSSKKQALPKFSRLAEFMKQEKFMAFQEKKPNTTRAPRLMRLTESTYHQIYGMHEPNRVNRVLKEWFDLKQPPVRLRTLKHLTSRFGARTERINQYLKLQQDIQEINDVKYSQYQLNKLKILKTAKQAEQTQQQRMKRRDDLRNVARMKTPQEKLLEF